MADRAGLTMIACSGNGRPLIPACSGMLSTQSYRQRPSLVNTHLEVPFVRFARNATTTHPSVRWPNSNHQLSVLPLPCHDSMGRICTSWNEGARIYPGSCSFRHVYSKCYQQSHRAKDCHAPARSRPSGPSGARVSQCSS